MVRNLREHPITLEEKIKAIALAAPLLTEHVDGIGGVNTYALGLVLGDLEELQLLRRVVAGMNGVSLHQTDRKADGGGHARGFSLKFAGEDMQFRFHPLTCGKDSNHVPLFPYWNGKKLQLICRDCNYTQDNAASWSVE